MSSDMEGNMGNVDPKLREILERHAHEKSKFPVNKDNLPITDSQSLEQMFGKEVAARMRRDAKKNANFLEPRQTDP